MFMYNIGACSQLTDQTKPSRFDRKSRLTEILMIYSVKTLAIFSLFGFELALSDLIEILYGYYIKH
jgi:hypothetical protein